MRTKLLAFLVFAALPCFGQTFGEITGVVSDSAGGVVDRRDVRKKLHKINLRS